MNKTFEVLFRIKIVFYIILLLEGGILMAEKNTYKDIRKNSPKGNNPGQPEPLSGSKKVKNRNHTRQKNNQGHDM